MAYRPSFSEAAWLAVGVVGTAAAAFSPSCALAQNAPATKAQPAAASAPVITLQTDCKTYRTGTGFFDAAACETERNRLAQEALRRAREEKQQVAVNEACAARVMQFVARVGKEEFIKIAGPFDPKKPCDLEARLPKAGAGLPSPVVARKPAAG